MFIDVGGGTTDVALVRHGGIAGTKMLALGGRAFTRGLAERFALPFARAEALKVAVADGATLPEARSSATALIAAMAADVGVWLGGVELMIGDLAEGELLPGRLFLCGGGARLPQIAGALRRGRLVATSAVLSPAGGPGPRTRRRRRAPRRERELATRRM